MLNIYLEIVNYSGKPTILLNRIKTNKDKLREKVRETELCCY